MRFLHRNRWFIAIALVNAIGLASEVWVIL